MSGFCVQGAILGGSIDLFMVLLFFCCLILLLASMRARESPSVGCRWRVYLSGDNSLVVWGVVGNLVLFVCFCFYCSGILGFFNPTKTSSAYHLATNYPFLVDCQSVDVRRHERVGDRKLCLGTVHCRARAAFCSDGHERHRRFWHL